MDNEKFQRNLGKHEPGSEHERCLDAERDIIAIMEEFYGWLSELDTKPGALVKTINEFRTRIDEFRTRIDEAIGSHPIANPLDDLIVDDEAIHYKLPKIRGLARRIVLQWRNGE